MDIQSYSEVTKVAAFGAAWDRFAAQELHFVPSFAEVHHQLLTPGVKFRLLVATANGEVAAIACFIYRDAIKRYEIISHKLFDLPVKEVTLYGSCVLGRVDAGTIRRIFRLVMDEGDFDLLNIGQIFIGSPLHDAVTGLKGLVAWRAERAGQLRWLIKLPGTFEAYLAQLRPTAKMRVSRDQRRFERAKPDYRVMRRPEDVDVFLRDAGAVSRLTYQWTLGYRVGDNDHARARMLRLAENGSFRGYIAYLDGKPCAFGWGELGNRTFNFVSTGYDPQDRNLSPGTALILFMIRDLIENTDCAVFDFGSGGETGYKSRLATTSLECVRMDAALMSRPCSLLLAGLDRTLNGAKNSILTLTDAVIGHGALRQRLKSLLRPYGMGTY